MAKFAGSKQVQDKITVNPSLKTTHLCLGHKSSCVNLIFDHVHSKKLWWYKEPSQSLKEQVVSAVELVYLHKFLSLCQEVCSCISKERWGKEGRTKATHSFTEGVMSALHLLLQGRVNQKCLPSIQPCFEVVPFGLI